MGISFLKSDTKHVKSCDIGLARGITGWVAKNSKPVLLGSVTEDSRYFGIRNHIHSEACFPISINGKIEGVLNVESTQKNAYDSHDSELLATIASQLATAALHDQWVSRQRMFRLKSEIVNLASSPEESHSLRSDIFERHYKLLQIESRLSERERVVLYKVKNGCLNKSIAKDLELTERGVELIRSRLMTKFSVDASAQLISLATELQLLKRLLNPSPNP